MRPKVPGYRILEPLGGGGVAEVFRAVSEEDGEEVALKLLRHPGRSGANQRRFLREGYLLQRLRHRGLPRCREVLREPRPCLVLELLEGRTLAERIADEGALPAEEVQRIAVEVLKVLAFLHERGVVHRDVKSSNIYLHRDGRVLLLDLGLAVDPADPFTTTLGDVLGTYAYMAPEQIAGAPVDHRSDLYSLGVTLYEALSGRRPFRARGTVGYLRAHRRGRPILLSELVPDAPELLVQEIHHLMSRDPSGRPPSARVALALLTGRPRAGRELHRPPIVGRAAAEGAVEGVLDAGGVLHVVGELGSGVGRVAEMAAERARQRGAEVIALRPRGGGPGRSLIEQLAAALSRVLGEPVRALEPEVLRRLEQLAEEGPLLLLVEDLHFSGPEGLALLRRIGTELPRLALVTTGLYEPDDFPGHVLHLRPLTEQEVQELLKGMLGATPPRELVSLLHRESGGLPAFVVLAVRALHARGALRWEGIGESGQPLWAVDPSLRRLSDAGFSLSLDWVLGELTPPMRAVLDVLAVAGERVPLELLLDAAGVDPSGLEAGLLRKVGLVAVEEGPDGSWVSIRRPLVAAMVARSLGPDSRREVHASLARALEAWTPSAWRDARLRLHRVLALPPDEAVPRLVGLAEESLRHGRFRAALDLVDQAASMPEQDVGLAARAAWVRGAALLGSGAWQAAREALAAARKLAEELDREELLARSCSALAWTHFHAGDSLRAEAEASRALSLARTPEQAGSRVDALLLTARLAWFRGEEERALSLLREAESAAERVASEALLAAVRVEAARIYMAAGAIERAQELLAAELPALARQPPGRVQVLVRCGLARLDTHRGAFQEALAHAAEGERMARAIEHPYLEACCGLERVRVYLAARELEGAAQQLRLQREAGSARAGAWLRLQYRLVQGELRLAIEDHQAALASFDAAADLARGLGFEAAVAFCEGMGAVMTADAETLESSIHVLGRRWHRRWMALLLMAGAKVVGDPGALVAAVEEARAAGDRPMLLAGLHAVGGEEARNEAAEIAGEILAGAPASLRRQLEHRPEFAWALGD